MKKKLQKNIVIIGRKMGDKVMTERKVITAPRRVEECGLPVSDKEWDEFFSQHQYGFGADLKSRHGMDLATEQKPLGPWFERLP